MQWTAVRPPNIPTGTAYFVLMVACAVMPAHGFGQNQPALSPANSAELQRLLRIQEKETAVLFARRTPPGGCGHLRMGGQVALSVLAACPNFTPPFPAYVSGHATIGGALFQILPHYYPDQTSFVFISDEWNGLNRGVDGKIRPMMPLHFASLSEAESRNAGSRVYLGVHWQFDADQGTMQGNQVGD